VPNSPQSASTPASVASQSSRDMTQRLRQSLVVALAVVSGATDAIGLLALGGAFTSVMTGNLVLLGVSVASGDGGRAVAAGGAVLAFCAGVAIGARVAGTARPDDTVWPRQVTRALFVEFALMATYAIGWWSTGTRPGQLTATAMLLCTAVALGVQSSMVQRFGVQGLSTTYLTGTLTTVVMRLTHGRSVREVQHSLEVIGGLLVGAAGGTALVLWARPLAPLLQLLLLAGVAVAAVVATRGVRR
jgi:uncharacterized membrane protein YoaK (UPF0700 family)